MFNFKDFEKKLIHKALEKSGGIIGGKCGAAELLGMKRTTLIHRMKNLNIKVEHYRSLNNSKLPLNKLGQNKVTTFPD